MIASIVHPKLSMVRKNLQPCMKNRDIACRRLVTRSEGSKETSASASPTNEEKSEGVTANPSESKVEAGPSAKPDAREDPTGPGNRKTSTHGDDEEDYFGSQELLSELKRDFGRRGEGLFFAQLASLILVIFCPFHVQGLLDLAGTLLLTTGVVFILYSLLSLGRNLSPMPMPRARHSLVTSGMYAYVRHPMYSGVLLAAMGLAALTRNETRLALTALLWWILDQKVRIEEQALLIRYPEHYKQYMSQVRKFIPWLY